jgi:hypothetical protein
MPRPPPSTPLHVCVGPRVGCFRLRVRWRPYYGRFADCRQLARLPSVLLTHHGHRGAMDEVLVLVAAPRRSLVAPMGRLAGGALRRGPPIRGHEL